MKLRKARVIPSDSEVLEKLLHTAQKDFNKVAKVIKGLLIQKSVRKLQTYREKNGISNNDEDGSNDKEEKLFVDHLKEIKEVNHTLVAECALAHLKNKLNIDSDNSDTIDISKLIKEILTHKKMSETVTKWIDKYNTTIETNQTLRDKAAAVAESKKNKDSNSNNDKKSNRNIAKRIPMRLNAMERTSNLFLGSLSDAADASADAIKQRRNEGRERRNREKEEYTKSAKKRREERGISNFAKNPNIYGPGDSGKGDGEEEKGSGYLPRGNKSQRSDNGEGGGDNNSSGEVLSPEAKAAAAVKAKEKMKNKGTEHPSWQAKIQQKNKSNEISQLLAGGANTTKKIVFNDDD